MPHGDQGVKMWRGENTGFKSTWMSDTGSLTWNAGAGCSNLAKVEISAVADLVFNGIS